MLHHESVGEAQSKKCYFMFTCSFVAFLYWFPSKSFSFLFLMKYQILQQNINQSETGTGDKKLLLERYV